jgi:hypothetical protein
MVSANVLQLQHDREHHRRLSAWASRHASLVWTACTCISLLSARHLLVESNFHHPVLVYLAQLCTTTTVVILHTPWRRKRHESNTQSSVAGIRPGKCIVFAAMGCTALAMFFMLQAVLHFGNLPTVIMLLVWYAPELPLHNRTDSLQIIAMFADDLFSCLLDHTSPTRTELLRIAVMFLACVGILATEYRLSVPALITSIPAMSFAGLASALSKFAPRHYRREKLPNRTEQLLYLVVTGYIIAATWVFISWPGKKAIVFDMKHAFLLITNAATTTTALLIGHSTLLPELELDTTTEPGSDEADTRAWRSWIILALVGVVGCHSTLAVRRSYTNWFQICFFVIAMLCIVYGEIQQSHVPIPSRTSMQYELLDIPEDDEEIASPIKTSHLARPAFFGARNLGLNCRSKSIIMAMLLTWVVFLCLNFSTGQRTTHSILDHDYKPVVPLEIVISMYKEPVGDVSDLIATLNAEPKTAGALVTIYNKDRDADTESIRLKTGADRVIQLPNVGREGETYLYHINHQWDELAQHTIFLQADIHNPREFYTRLWSYFDANRTGLLSLGWSGACSCEDCSDRFSWRDTTGLLPFYHNKIDKSAECKDILLSYKGQFVVSAGRIRGISKTIYSDLWRGFVDEDSWAHKPEYLQGRPDSMSAPDFGYTMERMWNVLFQCSDMEVAWRCPTLLSGWRLGGNIEDCQCFDSNRDEPDRINQ